MKSKGNVWKTMAGLLFTAFLMLGGYLSCDTDATNIMSTISREYIMQEKENTGEYRDTNENGKMEDNEVMSIKKIALTFDDGPNPVYTPMLLDGLKERGIHATFFLLGESAEKYPDLVRRIHKEGHMIGNHTYHHKDLQHADTLLVQQEVIKTNEVLKRITGDEPQFVRPPFGNYADNLEELSGMVVVLWNIDPLDWCCEDAAAIERRVEENAREDAIILMHDSSKYSVMAALTAIDNLKKEGYEFVTVDEIVFE